jgi:hypothetical protein
MSQTFLGQTSLQHTAGRVAKIFITISLNTVKVLRENNTHKRKKQKKYIYKLPRPSHNMYSKIVKPWLSEGSHPRALCCVSQTKFLSSMAETEFREQGKTSISTTATQERGQVSTGPPGSGEREGKGREGGSRDRRHHKELNKKDRTWLLRDS